MAEQKEQKEQKQEKKLSIEELNKALKGYIAQIEALRAEIAVINETITEYRNIIKTLAALKQLGKGKNIIIPVGSIAAIEAKIEDPEKVIITIGSGISAELKYDEAVAQIATQIAALEALRQTLEEAIAEAYIQIEAILQKTRELGQEEGKQQK